MYAQHFGLNQPPFSIAPDPRYLFMSDRHREALAHLLYGVRGGGGFVVLTGEVGAGKTTVCRALLNALDDHTKTALVLNPCLSDSQMLRAIVDEFRLQPAKTTRKDLYYTINHILLRDRRRPQRRVDHRPRPAT